jgi:cell division protease FtsH
MEAPNYSKEIQVLSQETSNIVWSEISQMMGGICDRLGILREDAALFHFNLFPSEFMQTDQRDPIYDTMGPLKEIPFCQTARINAPNRTVGWGTTFYKSRHDENVKYAVYTSLGPWGDIKHLICRKDQVLKLWYFARQSNKRANEITSPPILAEGLLEKIVQNTIGFLQKSREIEKYGVRIKRGVILEGDPGNGKTMACRYIQKLCSQNGYEWGIITSSDIDVAYEEGELNDLMQRYTVSFFDDIDIQYLDRSKGNGKIACSLLTAMDGMSEKGHLVRIFTTNERVDCLDKAFTRPGRIDTMITLEAPEANLRRKLVEERWPDEIKNNIDVDYLIERTEKFSFAELEAIRTFLVTEKVVNNGKWDLEHAFQEFDERQKEKSNAKLGFGSKPQQRKFLSQNCSPSPPQIEEGHG